MSTFRTLLSSQSFGSLVQCSPRLAPDSGDYSEQWATIVVGRLGSGIDVSRVIPTQRITDAERLLFVGEVEKAFRHPTPQ
jgi:hypothetical protein